MSLTAQCNTTKAEAWTVNGTTSIHVWRPDWGGFHSTDSYVETKDHMIYDFYLVELVAKIDADPNHYKGKMNL
jgi:hypothetical protein